MIFVDRTLDFRPIDYAGIMRLLELHCVLLDLQKDVLYE